MAKELNLKILKSYTTRPKRFPEEDNHILISNEEAYHIKIHEDIVAYTRIGEYQYFATLQQFIDSDLYIIDAKGVENLEQYHFENDIKFIKIFIKTDWALRKERVLMQRKDNTEIFNKRINDEAIQFDTFLRNARFDWVVNNNDLNNCVKIFIEIIKLYD